MNFLFLFSLFCVTCIQICFSILTDDDKNQLLAVHNNYRKTVANGQMTDQPSATNMLKMKWSSTSEAKAQITANKCVFKHDTNADRIYGEFKYVGQNLALFSVANITKGVDMWFNEITGYKYPTQTCSGVCGHYTQVVWAKSQELGCGAANCLYQGFDVIIMVCNYAPAGNDGNLPYETGSACNNCPSGTTCDEGLCA